ncbi:MAG: DUF370 domain-containing protein [Clostridia bacterium]|nr:DUF370 domain-containing protein [Clostridia bacterium]
MYINIGGDFILKDSDIVAIMDIENTSTSKITKEFLRKIGKSVINISDELPKSFIITKERGKTNLYISPVSSGTLYKRVKIVKAKGRNLSYAETDEL